MKHAIKILFFLCFTVGNVVFSQQNQTKVFKLKWVDNVDFEIRKDWKVNTSFVENNFLDANLNPTFTSNWKVNSNSRVTDFSIKNVVYQQVEEFNTYTIDAISSEVLIDLNIVKAANTTLAVLNLNPLVKVNNQIKRIVSFELDYTLGAAKLNVQKNTTVKNSVLAEGSWYKFTIDKTGVFKIDKDFLQKLGIDVNAIDPKNISIYGNGGAMLPLKNSDFRHNGLQENAIFINGENDASFDSGDYILFFASGPDSWDYGINQNLSSTKHNFNIYSEKAYYFLTIGSSNGKRISTQPAISESSNATITNFDDFVFYEKDEVNLFAAGQQWFGDGFNIENIRSYSIPFDEIDNSAPIEVRVRGVAQSSSVSKMDVLVNNQNLFEINYGAISGLNKAVANENSGSLTGSGNEVEVNINFNNNGNPSATAYLDYIEVLGKRKLTAKDDQFVFRNFNILKSTLRLFF